MLTRRHFIELSAAAALLPGCRKPAPPPPIDTTLAWLTTMQAPDGRFPSATYGFMRQGHSLTGLLAVALQAGGHEGRTLGQALGWLSGMLARGPLGFAGPALDYPDYATSLGLRALISAGQRDQLAGAISWLLDQQLTTGWEDHPAHGGFGMGRLAQHPAPTPPNAGHVDLSMTRRALQAIHLARQHQLLSADQATAALSAGADFTLRCKAGDGGFVYSPAELALNKSALTDGTTTAVSAADHKGYGSATADGVLALRACGRPDSDPAVANGLTWLATHFTVTENPGLAGAPIAAYATAMRFYWRAAAAEALTLAPDQQAAMSTAVMAEQQTDGRFQSEIALQKENDPLVATGLALLALAFVNS